eukprot:g6764.t1
MFRPKMNRMNRTHRLVRSKFVPDTHRNCCLRKQTTPLALARARTGSALSVLMEILSGLVLECDQVCGSNSNSWALVIRSVSGMKALPRKNAEAATFRVEGNQKYVNTFVGLDGAQAAKTITEVKKCGSRRVGPGSDGIGVYHNKAATGPDTRLLAPSLAAPNLTSTRGGRLRPMTAPSTKRIAKLLEPETLAEEDFLVVDASDSVLDFGDRSVEILGSADGDAAVDEGDDFPDEGEARSEQKQPPKPRLPHERHPHEPSHAFVTKLEPDFFIRGEPSSQIVTDLKVFMTADEQWRAHLVKFVHFHLTGSWHASSVRRYVADVSHGLLPLPGSHRDIPPQIPFEAISLAKFSTSKQKIRMKRSSSVVLSGACWDAQELAKQEMRDFVEDRFLTPRGRAQMEKTLEQYKIGDVLLDAEGNVGGVGGNKLKKKKSVKRDQTVVLDLLATLALGHQISRAITLQGCMEISNPSCRSANLRRALHAARKQVFEQLRKILVFSSARRYTVLTEDLDSLLSRHPLLCFNPVFAAGGGEFVPSGDCEEYAAKLDAEAKERLENTSMRPMSADGLWSFPTGEQHAARMPSGREVVVAAKSVVTDRSGRKLPVDPTAGAAKMANRSIGREKVLDRQNFARSDLAGGRRTASSVQGGPNDVVQGLVSLATPGELEAREDEQRVIEERQEGGHAEAVDDTSIKNTLVSTMKQRRPVCYYDYVGPPGSTSQEEDPVNDPHGNSASTLKATTSADDGDEEAPLSERAEYEQLARELRMKIVRETLCGTEDLLSSGQCPDCGCLIRKPNPEDNEGASDTESVHNDADVARIKQLEKEKEGQQKEIDRLLALIRIRDNELKEQETQIVAQKREISRLENECDKKDVQLLELGSSHLSVCDHHDFLVRGLYNALEADRQAKELISLDAKLEECKQLDAMRRVKGEMLFFVALPPVIGESGAAFGSPDFLKGLEKPIAEELEAAFVLGSSGAAAASSRSESKNGTSGTSGNKKPSSKEDANQEQTAKSFNFRVSVLKIGDFCPATALSARDGVIAESLSDANRRQERYFDIPKYDHAVSMGGLGSESEINDSADEAANDKNAVFGLVFSLAVPKDISLKYFEFLSKPGRSDSSASLEGEDAGEIEDGLDENGEPKPASETIQIGIPEAFFPTREIASKLATSSSLWERIQPCFAKGGSAKKNPIAPMMSESPEGSPDDAPANFVLPVQLIEELVYSQSGRLKFVDPNVRGGLGKHSLPPPRLSGPTRLLKCSYGGREDAPNNMLEPIVYPDKNKPTLPERQKGILQIPEEYAKQLSTYGKMVMRRSGLDEFLEYRCIASRMSMQACVRELGYLLTATPTAIDLCLREKQLLERQVNKLHRALRDLEGEHRYLQQQYAELEQFVVQLRDELEQLKVQLNNLMEQNALLEGENAELKAKLAKLEEEAGDALARMRELEELLQVAEEEKAKYLLAIDEMTNRIERLEREGVPATKKQMQEHGLRSQDLVGGGDAAEGDEEENKKRLKCGKYKVRSVFSRLYEDARQRLIRLQQLQREFKLAMEEQRMKILTCVNAETNLFPDFLQNPGNGNAANAGFQIQEDLSDVDNLTNFVLEHCGASAVRDGRREAWMAKTGGRPWSSPTKMVGSSPPRKVYGCAGTDRTTGRTHSGASTRTGGHTSPSRPGSGLQVGSRPPSSAHPNAAPVAIDIEEEATFLARNRLAGTMTTTRGSRGSNFSRVSGAVERELIALSPQDGAGPPMNSPANVVRGRESDGVGAVGGTGGGPHLFYPEQSSTSLSKTSDHSLLVVSDVEQETLQQHGRGSTASTIELKIEDVRQGHGTGAEDADEAPHHYGRSQSRALVGTGSSKPSSSTATAGAVAGAGAGPTMISGLHTAASTSALQAYQAAAARHKRAAVKIDDYNSLDKLATYAQGKTGLLLSLRRQDAVARGHLARCGSAHAGGSSRARSSTSKVDKSDPDGADNLMGLQITSAAPRIPAVVKMTDPNFNAQDPDGGFEFNFEDEGAEVLGGIKNGSEDAKETAHGGSGVVGHAIWRKEMSVTNENDSYECLTRTYGFEPMPEEINIFVSTMELQKEGGISWSEFQAGLVAIREKVKRISKKATHYDSYQDSMDDRRKHARVKFGPMEIYKRPMTTAQAVGWHEEEVFADRFPKSSCAETKYQDAVIRSGWIM